MNKTRVLFRKRSPINLKHVDRPMDPDYTLTYNNQEDRQSRGLLNPSHTLELRQINEAKNPLHLS